MPGYYELPASATLVDLRIIVGRSLHLSDGRSVEPFGSLPHMLIVVCMEGRMVPSWGFNLGGPAKSASA